MTWYFNNGGVADGPHGDEAMAALAEQKHIRGQTLVWHPEAPKWLELGQMAPAWWQPPVNQPAASEVVVKAKAQDKQATPATTRHFAPMAPSQEKDSARQAKPGFFKRLLGLGKSR